MTNYLINCYTAEINICLIVAINRFDRWRKRRIDSVLIREAVLLSGSLIKMINGPVKVTLITSADIFEAVPDLVCLLLFCFYNLKRYFIALI